MSRFVRLITALIAFAMVALPAAEAVAAVDSTMTLQPSTEPTGRVVEVTSTLRLVNITGDPVEDLQIVLPPMVMDRAASQRVLDVRFSVQPAETRPTPTGLEAVYRFIKVAPGEEIVIQQTYTVQLLDGAEVVMEEQIDPRYLAPEKWIESDNPAIQAQAAAVTAGLQTASEKAQAIVQFVSRHIRYNSRSPHRNKGALSGLQTQEGVCFEYATLFVAMARAAGVPARVVYGWGDPRGLGEDFQRKYHAWAEFYDAERGWVAVEPTWAATRHGDELMAFSVQNHLAQNLTMQSPSISYSGRGLLSVKKGLTMAVVQDGLAAVDAR